MTETKKAKADKTIEDMNRRAQDGGVTMVWDDDIEEIIAGQEDANPYKLTNPPRYVILTWVNYSDTVVIGLFPKVNPRNPEEKTSTIAVAPDNVSYEGLVDIYKALLEVKPDEVVEVSICHLSQEQLATIIACEYDQDQLFAFVYDHTDGHNPFFDVVTRVTLVESPKDIPPEELDAILAERRSIQSRKSGGSA